MNGCYRSGQAARIWGISPHLVRRLCEAGLIKAQRTRGGQWQIPRPEIERIQKDGLPEIPSSIEPDRGDYEQQDDLWEEISRVEESRSIQATHGATAQSCQDNPSIDSNLSHGMNWSDGAQRIDAERFRENRVSNDTAVGTETSQKRIEWHDSWLARAFRSLPADAPPELRLTIRDHVAGALREFGPEHAWYVVNPLVSAAVDKALRPWRRQKETERAIEFACASLPGAAKSPWAPNVWQVRAREAASAVVMKLSADSDFAAKLHAANAAVLQIASEFELTESRKRVLSCANLLDVAPESREDAKSEIQKKLEMLPPGTTTFAMERVREQVLTFFRQTFIESKKRQERVNKVVGHIRPYVEEQYRAGETHLKSDWQVWSFRRKLEEEIRPKLEEELLNRDLSDDDLREFLEELVDDALDEQWDSHG